MATIQELDDLTRYIRRVIPDRRQLSNVHNNEAAGLVEFEWHTRHFVATPTLTVFELKGQSLLLTCSSILMQAALHSNDRNSKVAEEIVDVISSAVDTMHGNQKEGLVLLQRAKNGLLRLIGKKSSSVQNPSKPAQRP